MVGVFRASHEGLEALATHCETVSAGLLTSAPVTSAGLPAQETANAVATTYTALGRAVTVLAARGQSTGVKAATAGAGFVVNDDAAARRLAGIDGSMSATGTPIGA